MKVIFAYTNEMKQADSIVEAELKGSPLDLMFREKLGNEPATTDPLDSLDTIE